MTGAEVICRPIAFGSIAFYLGKQATEGNSHKWSIYVRGLEDEDLSYFVQKVVFTLHPSCQIPVVVCDHPPYVVTQTGWGEFDCKISIFFRDTAESSVDIIHSLKLYPAGGSANNLSLLKKPVVNESYEEILFVDPEESFKKGLLGYKLAPKGERIPVSPSELRPYFSTFSEVNSMQALVAAQNYVSQEITKTAQEYAAIEDEINRLQKAASAAAGVVGGSAPSSTEVPPLMSGQPPVKKNRV
uniref:YEATS domain-containing protein n=1 Tax=Mucochytrium quahogii TaxID=96639 RepID=A0A7S2WDW5_9STRA|mmetsp:Transcript_16576/g.26901  ORF Transcript_16576/g.26901 Transcript_16576/m.26901 type:complete len:243 (+) Transcript_16576:146-874(+)|eukprot:CAMPEP_0203752526 /NCGR_PEP_ID=MMETSP0098-20131031/6438_1 /ASSEMBLY_ACC=CAM_ASM_000208 /TAXON_ID=96639 /ORGANISM=" , Strain NY0313808BC1" /LENGTH=242 /DNA_ID=CAMNT_0050642731 /DNA_START=131 /DNA_END=859 /DNA_ORIENTATION=-